MKKLIVVFAVTLFPLAAFAIGPATLNNAGATPQTTPGTTSQVSVTIPAVISIDVESDITFDFNSVHYHSPASTLDCTDAWPPGAACTNVTYTPSTVTLPASGGTTGQIWLAIFSNKSGVQGTMKVQAYGDAAFSSDPGFTPQKIKLAKGTTNSGPSGGQFGLNTATFIGTAGTPLDLTAAAPTSSVFGWTRIDQSPTLVVPANGPFNVVTNSTANITFTLSY